MINKIKRFIAKQGTNGDNTVLYAIVIIIFLVAAIWTTLGIIGILQNSGIIGAGAQ